MNYYTITPEEKRSILFYQGGCKNITLSENEQHLESFYKTESTYEVINTLLFPGIDNETMRISHEHRHLNTVLLDNMSELLNIYCNIYSAMCKYSLSQTEKGYYYLYRKDRVNTLNALENGYIPYFFSTSFNHKINPYFHQKEGILLLELEVPYYIEHIDVNEVLGDLSLHPNEEEILLSPFLSIGMEPMDFTKEETDFKDKNLEAPKKKFKISIKGSTIPAKNYSASSIVLANNLKENIIKQQYINCAKQLWHDLEQGKQLDPTLINSYIEWKEYIRTYLRLQFSHIKAELTYGFKYKNFKIELDNYIAYTNNNRKKYDYQFTNINLCISCLQPLGALFLALSFISEETWWPIAARIISLTMNTGCIILSGIAKSLSLEGKCAQRTKTYLRLDELRRDFEYEDDKSLETLNKYIDKFKQIIKEDDALCVENMDNASNHFKQLQNDMQSNLKNQQ